MFCNFIFFNVQVSEGYILRELIYGLQGAEGTLFQRESKDLVVTIKVSNESKNFNHKF